ncbi:MAG: Rpn family recombination-promoting nuclease/putative transposase [Labilithrix sp.]|nr:Rpn family recombination-promoting nuclease/putative transposase [Labilithrix sp.]MCW5812004.1 Rpn family recombination-promoting nuclease/putative transposase [Labilithrix sp.]
MEWLDPKLDVVFKLLFTRYEMLLRNMLEAVLNREIADLEVLNPQIHGERSGDKAIQLDVRVRLIDGTRVDVEMQLRAEDALVERLVYYAAREYSGQLERGGQYNDLTPTVLIVWMVAPLFPDLEQYHSIFELRERRTNKLFSEQLALHVLQLGFIHRDDGAGVTARDDALRRWGRFLLAKTEAELDALALEDPIMSAARSALDQLSQDPEAARLARERSDAIKLNDIALARAHKRGEIEGKIEGKIEAILAVLAARGLSVAEEARVRIATEKDPVVLDRWLTRAVIVTDVAELFLSEPTRP